MSDGIAPIDQALMPTAVRNGDAQRKQQYQAALQFERVLVGQMTQAMTKSAFSSDDDSDGGDDGSGTGGSDAATQQLKQTLPDTLADALMSNGGIGLAGQLDAMWHPATSTSVGKNQADAANAGGATTGATAAPSAASGGASA